ncbi:MAG: hypothetical protein OXR67_00675 [Chloroflexota bacterium]|nr:hypothetical protein [Chloroflexota bacterium]
MIEHIDVYADSSDLPTECLLSAGYSWDDSWELARDLRIEVQTSEQEIVALAGLADGEYGVGSNLREAVYDLLTSMSGYLDALQSRENRLSESAATELKALREVVRRKDSE